MSPKSHSSHSTVRLVLNLVLSAILVGAATYLLLNRQHVIDQVTVWQYHPTSEVVNLVERAGMNDNGKFLYYASQPTLESTQNFNKECDRLEASTSILGCYTNDRIYIYNVTDPQLDGIREVTAAHETLHAAYQRLSSSERTKVDALLEAEYAKLENNPDFKERMAFYARTEPGERDNELHSVIGTEVATVSPELEAYYKQYFSDRQKVTTLAAQYKGVFASLTNQANQIAGELTSLANDIQSRSVTYNSDVQKLNNDIQTFNNKAASGGFSSQAQFKSERADLVAREATLNSERTAVNDSISRYNTLLDQYNSIAAASKKLYNSIDSTLAPAPSI